MSERIKDDDTLERPTSGYIEEPLVIVHQIEGGRFGYIINSSPADERGDNPAVFGVVLSDLLDHIAAHYHNITGRDERDIRAHIFKVMKDEDRFKEKDPSRGNATGKTFMGPRS